MYFWRQDYNFAALLFNMVWIDLNIFFKKVIIISSIFQSQKHFNGVHQYICFPMDVWNGWLCGKLNDFSSQSLSLTSASANDTWGDYLATDLLNVIMMNEREVSQDLTSIALHIYCSNAWLGMRMNESEWIGGCRIMWVCVYLSSVVVTTLGYGWTPLVPECNIT